MKMGRSRTRVNPHLKKGQSLKKATLGKTTTDVFGSSSAFPAVKCSELTGNGILSSI